MYLFSLVFFLQFVFLHPVFICVNMDDLSWINEKNKCKGAKNRIRKLLRSKCMQNYPVMLTRLYILLSVYIETFYYYGIYVALI